MIPPARPHDEAQRAAELGAYRILDTPTDASFEALVELAALICGTPFAMVTLVGAERCWLKAAVGLDAAELPRDVGLCAWTVAAQAPLVVGDLAADARFADHPLVVAGPRLRCYAGWPLLTPNGHAIGALAVADVRPRELSATQREALAGLAVQAMALLEAHRRSAEAVARAEDRAADQLSRIEWLLGGARSSAGGESAGPAAPSYGDLADLNTDRTLLGAVGRYRLDELLGEHLELLESVATVYERNGDVAQRRLASQWCRLLDAASRQQCGTDDNRAALASDRWLCQVGCWRHASQPAMESGAPVDVACPGGLRLHAVPIVAAGRVVGAITSGYGDPPRDAASLKRIATAYGVDQDELQAAAEAYQSRPAFLVELARKRLHSAARLVGTMVERHRAEESLRQSEHRFQTAFRLMPGAVVITRLSDGMVVEVNDYCEQYTGYRTAEVRGRTVQDLGVWYEPAEGERLQARIRADGRLSDAAMQIRLKDGSMRRGLVSAVVLRLGDEPHLLSVFRDTTEQQAAEEALRASEARFRSTFDESPIGAALVDTSGRIERANAAFCRLLGHTAEQLREVTYLELVHPDERAPSEVLARRMLAGEMSTHAADTRFVTRAGATLWARATVCLLHGTDGEPRHFLPMVQDITEHRRFEEALSESETRFRQLSEAAHEGIAVSRDGVVLDANQRFGEMVGLDPADLIGRPVVSFVEPQDAPRVARYLAESFAGSYDATFVRADGTTLPVEVQARYMPFAGGQARVASVRDLTGRHAADAALAESERKYRELVENANSIILRWRPDGTITFLNECGQRVFGWRAEELVGRNVMDTIVPHTESTGRDLGPLMARITANPKEFEQNTNENVRRNGERVWVAWTNRAIRDQAGEISEVFSVGADITEQRRLEEQFRQAQKLESVGQLAAGVAHDFNNLLTVILGNASLLQPVLAGDASSSEWLNEAIEAGERAADLTRQLLLFSRRQPVRLVPLDVNVLTTNLARMLGRLLGEEIHLTLTLAPRLPAVEADQGMLEQALMNLAVNARDAMPEGGELVLATTLVLAAPPVSNDAPRLPRPHVCLTVRDTGCGIPNEIADRVFEPFFTTKEPGKGTGLGLAGVYGIARQHNGWVELDSQVGVGTTMRLYLPVAQRVADRSASPADRPPPATAGERVLVAEDDPSVRRLCASMLQAHGFQVTVTSSGAEAAALPTATLDEIDLLVTDLVMPGGVSGRDLAEVVRARRPSLAVVYMSGYSNESPALDLRAGQRAVFLQKPFGRKALLAAVSEALRGVPRGE